VQYDLFGRIDGVNVYSTFASSCYSLRRVT
jgi:hypothetical protein